MTLRIGLLATLRLLRAPSAAIGAAILALLLGAAATAGWLYPDLSLIHI